jgi:hypothetical protein
VALDLDTLESLGYFKHVRPEERPRLREEIAASDYPLSIEVRRSYFSDAEDLAERGVLDFLVEVAPYLRHEGVPIEITYAEAKQKATPERGIPVRRAVPTFDADGWVDPPNQTQRAERFLVSLGRGKPLVEMREDENDGYDPDYVLHLGDREIVIYRPGETDESWYRATRVTIELIEELLAAHGSRDRVYVDAYGGNDQTFFFLTPEMASVINDGARRGRLLGSGELEENEERGPPPPPISRS